MRGLFRKTYFIQQVHSRLLCLFSFHFLYVYKRIRNIFQHGSVLKEIVVLENHRAFLAKIPDFLFAQAAVLEFFPVETDLPRLRFFKVIDTPEQGGFAQTDGPMTVTISPSQTSKLIPLSTSRSLNDL